MNREEMNQLAATIRSEVQRALDSTTFKGRQREVIEKRFALNGNPAGYAQSLESIAKEYDVTRERIRQLEANGLRQIRATLQRDWSEYSWWLDITHELSFMRAIEQWPRKEEIEE